MPEFVDLILPLGERIMAQDFFSNGFYQHTRLSDDARGLVVPERAWSGRDFQICYSLKSVERSEVQTDWPWSVRHCATHHAFDIENVRSTWIVVKGNPILKERITSATSARAPPEFSSYDNIENAFAAALSTHMIIVDWSAENWRWYINFLEDKFREITEGAISTDADIPLSPKETEDVFALGPRTNTQNTNQTRKSRPFPFLSAGHKTDTTTTVAEALPPQQFQQKDEKVTHEMSRIARKTKTETVSMKIITLVTLFFLPGTFIATVISTDIIKWNNGKQKYQPGAMHVYLAVCLPFMAATFIFWAAFQWHERRKEHRQREKAEAEV
ncbi:MAG: hypothetical protein Q9207_000432 [Kuettlingeria erythrocarpa]